MIVFELGFVIVILRLDTTNEQHERKTFAMFGFEKDGKYRRYKKDIDMTIESRKCRCLVSL